MVLFFSSESALHNTSPRDGEGEPNVTDSLEIASASVSAGCQGSSTKKASAGESEAGLNDDDVGYFPPSFVIFVLFFRGFDKQLLPAAKAPSLHGKNRRRKLSKTCVVNFFRFENR